MSYVVVGVICLVAGAVLGMFGLALCVASKNMDVHVENISREGDEQEEK